MSLNNINLSPTLLVDLYATVLVETTAMSMPDSAAHEYAGKNQKGILIVAANENESLIADKELQFLYSILTACKLSPDDVAISDFSQVKKDYQEWNKLIKFETVLLFGVTPQAFGLPVHFPHYQVQSLAARTYIYAPPLSEIESNQEAKKLLWTSLKKHFAL